MNKRQFLGATAVAAGAPALAANGAPAGPALLTVTGAIGRGNRGPLDPVRDQMMRKQKLGFTRAWALDFAALLRLPAQTIRPTLEYDGKAHQLRGPALIDVLREAGWNGGDGDQVVLRAVDGYAAAVSVRQARAQRFIVATHMDGAPMALGGLGPLWAVYDADRVPEMAARPLAERFGACPWALYHVEVRPAQA
jgi:hypothetical protein